MERHRREVSRIVTDRSALYVVRQRHDDGVWTVWGSTDNAEMVCVWVDAFLGWALLAGETVRVETLPRPAYLNPAPDATPDRGGDERTILAPYREESPDVHEEGTG